MDDIMRLFKPAWKSNNFNKAIRAVEKETEQDKLLEIFKSAPNTLIRNEAVRKLNVSTVREIKDQYLLMDIAKNVSASHDTRKAAKNNLKSQKILADMAVNSDDIDVRQIAVDKLTDQTALAHIIQYEKFDNIRLVAAEKYADQSFVQPVYAQIAKKAVYWSQSVDETCKRAVHRLSDPKLLADVAINVKDQRIGIKAVERLNDQALLLEVAKNAKPDAVLSLTVMMAAIKKIKDVKILNELANDTNFNLPLRKAAFLEKTNRMLKNEMKKEDIENIFHIGTENIKDITDQTALAYLAINYDNNHTAQMAVEQITDTKMLYYVAMCCRWNIHLEDYIKTSTNKNELQDIIEYSSIDYTYKKLATERLSELQSESI